MSDAHGKQHEYRELQRQARVNEMRLKIARQNAALGSLRRDGYRDTLEGFYDPSNIFDPRDYLFETPRFGGAIPTTLNDRDDGRNYPLFRTEQELAVIRGAARLISASNPIAVGILASLTNYVIGNGFHYTAAARRPNQGDIVATAGAVIDEFLTDNDWCGDLDRELFQRSRVDGEYFLGLWHVGGGHVQARAIEPDQVTEPGNKAGLEEWLGLAESAASSWTFGVHSDALDAQEIHGYYVQWTNRDLDWDYLPGGNAPIIPPHGAGTWLEHAKLNVVRSVKRGLSDFFSIQGNLELARRVLRNMGEGSAVQAAIAWIQEVAPGTTQAQVNTGRLSRADASYTTTTSQGANRVHFLQQYDPGTILKVPSGQKYLPGPLGAQHAPSFITAAESLLRTVALRWNLPEHLVTGSAANNNFASSLVAETPFVKYAESQQQFYVRRDRRTLWRVLWFAWTAGRFGDAPWRLVQQVIEVTVTPPQIEVRDPEKETRVRQMLNAAGILSRHTWAAQESLDYDQEQKNLKAEAASRSSVASGSMTVAGHHVGRMDEALEEWDQAKHPRGGFSQNRGWFSETGGTTGSTKEAPTVRMTPPESGGLHRASAAVVPLAATTTLLPPAGPRPNPVKPLAPPPAARAPSPSSATGKPGAPIKGISPAAGASAALPGLASGSFLDQGGTPYVPNNRQKLDYMLDVVAAKLRNSGLSQDDAKEIAARITKRVNANLAAARNGTEPLELPNSPREAADMADGLIAQAKREAAAGKAALQNNLPANDAGAAPVPHTAAAGGRGKLPPTPPVAQGPDPRPDDNDPDELPLQSHHYATNKSKTYTPKMKEIADRYGLDLDEVWNKERLPQLGRHPNDYHELVLIGMQRAAREAGADKTKFLELFRKYVIEPVRRNPQLLRKSGWQ